MLQNQITTYYNMKHYELDCVLIKSMGIKTNVNNEQWCQ